MISEPVETWMNLKRLAATGYGTGAVLNDVERGKLGISPSFLVFSDGHNKRSGWILRDRVDAVQVEENVIRLLAAGVVYHLELEGAADATKLSELLSDEPGPDEDEDA
ncbi:MAG: hypothetical protein WEE64_02610 [Dehalococcoidia bacterium]